MILKNAPPWMMWALGELGVKEKPGPASEAKILAYRKIGKIKGVSATQDDSTLPWCAVFANAAIEASGFRGNGGAGAQNMKTVGVGLTDFALGAVVVLGAGKGQPAWTGHVGFYRGHDAKGRVVLLGGNQGDSVSFSPFPASRVIAIRWPDPNNLPKTHGKISFETGKPLQEVSDR